MDKKKIENFKYFFPDGSKITTQLTRIMLWLKKK